MKKILRYSLFFFLSFVIVVSCSKDSGSGGGGGGGGTVNCASVSNKAFTADVNPIIQSVCAVAGCHAAGSTNGPGSLTDYTSIFAARSAIRTAVNSGRMPQGSTLSSSQKNSIICWIDGGAPNN